MKKLILLLLLINSITGYSQNKYDIEFVEKSEDPKVLANFIVNNPNHPKILHIKQRLTGIINTSTTTKPNESLGKNNIPIENFSPKQNNHQLTTDILNHLLKDNPNKSNSSYIVIRNLSNCGISVSFVGGKHYNLDIAPKSLGRILVDKGQYNISSKICNANFNTNKTINSDFEMSLNNVITTKKQ